MLDCLVPLGVMMVSVKEGCRCDKRFLILNLGDFPCNIWNENTFCYEHSELSVQWWKAHFLEPTKFRLFDVLKLMLPDIKIMAQVLCIFWIFYQWCCCFVQPVSVLQCALFPWDRKKKKGNDRECERKEKNDEERYRKTEIQRNIEIYSEREWRESKNVRKKRKKSEKIQSKSEKTSLQTNYLG